VTTAALGAVGANVSGDGAEERVEELPSANEPAIDAKERAEKRTVVAVAAGLLAVASLGALRRPLLQRAAMGTAAAAAVSSQRGNARSMASARISTRTSPASAPPHRSPHSACRAFTSR
jgi:hypothetical protein